MKQNTLGQAELLSLQNTTTETNTSNNNSNSELVEKERVDNTAFDIVGNKDHGYFIALGTYRLTPTYPLKATLKKMIKEKDYELLLGMMGATIQAHMSSQAWGNKINSEEMQLKKVKDADQQTLPTEGI